MSELEILEMSQKLSVLFVATNLQIGKSVFVFYVKTRLVPS
jgi:hypothetical protein